MKILAVSDEESKYFFEYYTPGKLKDYDLIIACGDLRVSYLEFLVTMARCPLLYVHGNHDDRFPREPEGCICIDDRLYEYQGLRILGLGGSYRYGQGSYMYTERQMRRRIRRLRFTLWRDAAPPRLRVLRGAAGPLPAPALPPRAHPPQLRRGYPAQYAARRHADRQRLRVYGGGDLTNRHQTAPDRAGTAS